MRRSWPFAAVLLTAVLAAAQCSNYGEGDRCYYNNNNDDCQDGLVCVQASTLGAGADSDLCCPPAGSPISKPQCYVGSSAAAADAGADAADAAGDATEGGLDASDAGDATDGATGSDAADAANADGG